MMFRQVLRVAVPLAAAETRLAARLAVDRLQPQASLSNAQGGEILIRAGFGPITKQVVVLAVDPYTREHTIVFPIRWEATGTAGHLFPSLDANIELSPAVGDHGVAATNVVLIGSYRPPLGTIGKIIDNAILGRAAQATVSTFLNHLASVLDPEPERMPSASTRPTLLNPETEIT